jgi:hypothetical protein
MAVASQFELACASSSMRRRQGSQPTSTKPPPSGAIRLCLLPWEVLARLAAAFAGLLSFLLHMEATHRAASHRERRSKRQKSH